MTYSLAELMYACSDDDICHVELEYGRFDSKTPRPRYFSELSLFYSMWGRYFAAGRPSADLCLSAGPHVRRLGICQIPGDLSVPGSELGAAKCCHLRADAVIEDQATPLTCGFINELRL